jgi:hypothetical protein
MAPMLSTEKKWLDYSLPVMNQMREELAATDAVVLAARTSADYARSDGGRGQFALDYIGRTYHISYPAFEAIAAETGQECPPGLLFLLLHYFRTADAQPLAHRWISYRELPHGMFYFHAFQGYAGNRLVKTFGNDLSSFEKAASKAGGEALSHGDAGFLFWALPRIPLAAVYWVGDDEFPPSANVLFDASAGHYLSTDGLAVLGRELCSKIIRQL